MKAYCKKSYCKKSPGYRFIENNWYRYETTWFLKECQGEIVVETYIQIYPTNKTNNEYFNFIPKNEMLALNSNNEWENWIFEDYFYTEKELRQLKLKQINESIF